MLTIKIRGYRGISSADFTVSRIALITGQNGAGKTSILQAVGSALCGRPLPVDGVRRADANDLVNAGSDSGFVKVADDDGHVAVSWPACEPRSEGKAPPTSTAIACGLDDVLALPDRDRIDLLAKILRSQPTADDVAQALAAQDIGAPIAKLVWDLIETDGWDAAFSRAKKKGQEMKGAWQQITRETYGSVKAAQWCPADYSASDLEDSEEADLQKAVASAQASVEAAIAASAVDSAALDNLRSQAAEEPVLVERRGPAADALAKAETALADAQAKRAALPPADGDNSMPCPHCEKPIVLRSVSPGVSKLQKAPDKVTDAELKKRRAAIAAADGEHARLRDARNDAARVLAEIDAALAAAQAAKAKLAAAPARTSGGDAPDVSAARVALAAAQARLDAWTALMDARHTHDQIVQNAVIQDVLKPEGLRKAKAVNAIEAFNSTIMQPLCESADWAPVCLTPEFTAIYGGRAYHLLSASEKYRVRVTLQVALARIENVDLVVIDAADILDSHGREGLMGMLDYDDGPLSLVAMTIPMRERAPDLSKAGLGETWWVENGTLEAFGHSDEDDA